MNVGALLYAHMQQGSRDAPNVLQTMSVSIKSLRNTAEFVEVSTVNMVLSVLNVEYVEQCVLDVIAWLFERRVPFVHTAIPKQ